MYKFIVKSRPLAVYLASFPGSPHARTYRKRRKAGQGLGTRLLFILYTNKLPIPTRGMSFNPIDTPKSLNFTRSILMMSVITRLTQIKLTCHGVNSHEVNSHEINTIQREIFASINFREFLPGKCFLQVLIL